jgi:anion-transporting  ArsA/GET3 family ATPase
VKPLFDHPLTVVLGKGGVGRTTVAAALGVAAAARGRDACVAELGESAAAEALQLSGRSFAFRESAWGPATWSLTVPECLDEFGKRKLHLPFVARGLLQNRAVSLFVDAVPGLHDLLLLGKIENLLREPVAGDPRFDTLFLDAPATGHGLTLLQAARAMTDIARSGPFHDLAARIRDLVDDPLATALVLVTLPEELPVSETVELAHAIAAHGQRVHTVIVNRTDPFELPDPPGLPVVRQVLGRVPGADALLELVDGREARAERQLDAVRTLARELPGTRIVTAPRVPATDRVKRLADVLAGVIA